MRILSIGNFFNPSWDGSQPDEEHIASALEEFGHEVTRAQREDNIHFTPHPSAPFDFILIAQWDGYKPDIITMLRKNYRISWRSNVPDKVPKIVYWAFDYQADGQEWHERLIADSDLYLSKRIADSKYPNWQYLAQDFAPQFLDKYPHKVDKDIDVLFTGSYLEWATERNATIKAVNEKFNLVVHSVNDWPFLDRKPPIMDGGLPELYARAKVILSIDHTLEAGYHSDRNAQIMCCGERPLFRYVPSSETAFHDHVDYFYNIDDCLEKVKTRLDAGGYVQNTDSYEYAQTNLKVNNRVQDLLTIVRSIL